VGAPPNSIFDLDPPGLQSLLESWNEPAYRSRQIWEGVYRGLHESWSEFTSLPKSLRERLERELDLQALSPAARVESADHRTEKIAFTLQDGRQIETVLMWYARRATLCISTQVGCAMGCVFCATGEMGYRRNLSKGEIVGQVIHFARKLRAKDRALTNIVVMGMGEPFHNYESTLSAIDCLSDKAGFGFGARRFTISTVGLPPMIRRFADEKRQINLAISLHAADDALRSSMLPVNKKYPIRQVLDACRYYSAQTGRRLTFEWALIRGVNDTRDAARKLGALLAGMLCHVNAIPLNPTAGYRGQATLHEASLLFKAELEAMGISCTVRLRRGVEIAAGCGQLVVV
jgi:23S rRNA (adenine2503-C2)-methyltransferase